MAMALPYPPAGEWTVEDVWALPDDGNRHEVIQGVLYVTPAPRLVHQVAVGELAARLRTFVREHRVGLLVAGPADIAYDARTLVQPDLLVAPLVHGRRPRGYDEITRLVLAVEVLSPGTASRDRGIKRRLYQHHGTGEYWIVDLDGRVVERWRADDERPEVADGVLEWRPEGAAEALAIDLPGYFSDVLDEKD